MSGDAFEDRPTESLMDDGYTALREERIDDALAIARELRNRRHSSAFEIEARARWHQGERDAAVRVLEEGVGKAPKASPLWHWLACYCSDLGRYDAALEAFAREADFEDVVPSANAYNVAVVLERMERAAEALDVLDRVELPGSDPSPAHFSELRARLLFDVGRFDEAIEAATLAEEQFTTDAEAYADKANEASAEDAREDVPLDWIMMARVFAVRADARLACGDAAGAIEDAESSIDINPPDAPDRALATLRQAEGQRSEAARQLRLLVRGEIAIDEEPRRLGFFTWLDVVADDAAEAMEFARRFVPEAARPSLEIDEKEDHGAVADRLKGVYVCGQPQFFDPDAPDDEGDVEGGDAPERS
jgi:tetratricopeptide (TPR) repeat protein